MHYRQILFIGPALALSACATANDRRDIPGCVEMECVALGKAQQLSRTLTVTPLAVLEDSRCPMEARCVWAGRLVVKLRLDMGHESMEVDLASDEDVRINSGMLAFAEIAPVASIKWADLKPREYAFSFRFAPDIAPDPAIAPTTLQ